MIKLFTKKRKGFTLIELIVVIAILAILAAIAIPRLSGARHTAAQSAHEANIRTIESAISIYQAEKGEWPANIDALVNAGLLKENPDVPDGIASSEPTTGSTAGKYGLNGGSATVQPTVTWTAP